MEDELKGRVEASPELYYHEILDRTAFVADIVGILAGHAVFSLEDDWREQIEHIHEKLFTLYQDIVEKRFKYGTAGD